ncbi:hypothetical protein BDR26DRAFT_862899 [Obelidium mucronatum]|nr:hypothetical protein BDR26DRAFT_862899 [Obelidium mucronatum]
MVKWVSRVRRRHVAYALLLVVLWIIVVATYLDLLLLNAYHHHFNSQRSAPSHHTESAAMSINGTIETKIPNYILRIFKTSLREEIKISSSNGSDHPLRYSWFTTWDKQNPHHVQILLDDDSMHRFVRGHFDKKIQEAFFKLPHLVQQTDFARYLLLYEIGGVYTDMDTECWTPIDQWGISYSLHELSGIVGIEVFNNLHLMDQVYKVNGLDQVAQWTMALAPKHAFLERLIAGLTKSILESSEERLAGVEHVIGLTGPGYWSYKLWEFFWDQEFQVSGMQGIDRSYRVFGDFLVLGRTRFARPGTFSRHRGTGEMKGGWKSQKIPLKKGSSNPLGDVGFPEQKPVIPYRILSTSPKTNRNLHNSWKSLNLNHWMINFWVDDLDRFVKGGFSKRIVGAYLKLPVEWKGEFGRYLMLYKFGGVIVDSLNVECLVPLNKWDFGVQALDLILGLEDNVSLRFSQTVVAAGPQNPFVLALIRYITDKLVNMSYAEAKDQSNFSETLGRSMFQTVGQNFFVDQSAEALRNLEDSKDGYSVIMGRGGKTLLLGSQFTSGSDALFKE